MFTGYDESNLILVAINRNSSVFIYNLTKKNAQYTFANHVETVLLRSKDKE